MLDLKRNVLYVGKAKNLRRRVRSYFHKGKKPAKIERLFKRVRRIDCIQTENEQFALLLENQLIRALWPPYNSVGKETPRYPFVMLDRSDFPIPTVVRAIDKPGSYYGPFGSARALEALIELASDEFRLRRCKAMGSRPCLYYEIERCVGPCTGLIDRDEYLARLSPLIEALEGHPSRLRLALEKRMAIAADDLDFERAARCRTAARFLSMPPFAKISSPSFSSPPFRPPFLNLLA